MSIITPADENFQIAAAIGRFSQACNYLEDHLIFTITRLLPVTTDMGRALLAGNQMRRNIDILQALLHLPEIPISQEDRTKLGSLVPRLKAINDDRSRFLHNTLLWGAGQKTEGPADTLFLKIDKQDGKNSAMYPVSIEMLNEITNKVKSAYTDLYISPVKYDLSEWTMEFTGYPSKKYPTRQV
ncbi:hypothetical protein [Xanthobacter autotrophicus]|uniref:hypothetical protein n=1 Tax=Xanthobacter autotrophicus TaxID=280 RepID=UPI00372A472E